LPPSESNISAEKYFASMGYGFVPFTGIRGLRASEICIRGFKMAGFRTTPARIGRYY
jgi:hypothetical protein